jgi:hypothetical protein
MSTWGDGTQRLCWELTITRVNGGYKVKITDHDLLRYTHAFALTFDTIPEEIERKITSYNPGWEDMQKSYRNKKGLDKFKKKG